MYDFYFIKFENNETYFDIVFGKENRVKYFIE